MDGGYRGELITHESWLESGEGKLMSFGPKQEIMKLMERGRTPGTVRQNLGLY
jgi:hypothetical protein